MSPSTRSRAREIEDTVTEAAQAPAKLSGEDKRRLALLEALDELGGRLANEDKIEFSGDKFIIPSTFAGDWDGVFRHLREHVESEETETLFERTFKFRPFDGAHALQRAFQRVFGTVGIQKPTITFFGKIPPRMRTINVGVNETAQVPWGEIAVPIFDGTMTLGGQMDPNLGPLFSLSILAPRKHRGRIEGLFDLVESELKERSIYRGKAIDGQEEAEFLDLSGVDESKVIYSRQIQTEIATHVWTPLRHSQLLRNLGVPLKRAVLLEGPYGTGKTLAAFLTAQRAVDESWTFVYCRPGKDDLNQVVQTARLYQPAVVFFEDVDSIANTGDPEAVTKLLDLFDGITAKGTELMIVMTTNHKEKIHAGMIRPGRLDAVISFGSLDREGTEALIRSIITPEMLDPDIDYDEVFLSMEGYLPAFCKEVVDGAIRFAVMRTDGEPSVFTTEDFVGSAKSLRAQYDLMNEAKEGVPTPPLDMRFRRLIEDVVHEAALVSNRDGEASHHLEVAGKNGK